MLDFSVFTSNTLSLSLFLSLSLSLFLSPLSLPLSLSLSLCLFFLYLPSLHFLSLTVKRLRSTLVLVKLTPHPTHLQTPNQEDREETVQLLLLERSFTLPALTESTESALTL